MNDPQQTVKRKKGCLFYGCLTLAVLSLAVLLGGGFGLYFLYQKAQTFVSQYAADEPMQLPKVQFTDADKEQFEERLKLFADGLQEDKPASPLVLKGQDLNLLLASSPDAQTFAKGVRAKVEGDAIKGQVSLKLGDLGAPFFKDRYLNGEVSFKVSLQDGVLTISPQEILVNGKELPEKYLSAIRDHNFAESANQNPDIARTLELIQSIEVKDGAVRVVPKETE